MDLRSAHNFEHLGSNLLCLLNAVAPCVDYLYTMPNSHSNYLNVNRQLWNDRVPVHINSSFYDVAAFKLSKNSLNPIELALLGDVNKQHWLHLQCHFGMDTLSLSQRGAIVTGLDFSEKAIDAARNLSKELQLPATFICSEVYATPESLNHQFDGVFTSYGTIGWLPNLNAWAATIARCLKPNGVFVMADFHPVIWMYDNAIQHITYSYFNRETIFETEEGTYAQTDAALQHTSISWNHPISDILNALISAGLRIDVFNEYDYSPYACFPNMVETQPGQFQRSEWQGKVPWVYAIKAVKQ